MAGSFAKGTAIGGLPVPIAVIALPQPADPCFSDLDSRNPEAWSKTAILARRREAGEAGRVRGSEPQQ
jgi:hypothetical protein